MRLLWACKLMLYVLSLHLVHHTNAHRSLIVIPAGHTSRAHLVTQSTMWLLIDCMFQSVMGTHTPSCGPCVVDLNEQ